VLLVAGGITVMYQAMRAVMEVGGYCASGGPYEIRQECPDATRRGVTMTDRLRLTVLLVAAAAATVGIWAGAWLWSAAS